MFVHTFTNILAKKLFGNDLLPEIAKNLLTSPNYISLSGCLPFCPSVGLCVSQMVLQVSHRGLLQSLVTVAVQS